MNQLQVPVQLVRLTAVQAKASVKAWVKQTLWTQAVHWKYGITEPGTHTLQEVRTRKEIAKWAITTAVSIYNASPTGQLMPLPYRPM